MPEGNSRIKYDEGLEKGNVLEEIADILEEDVEVINEMVVDITA